MSPTTHGTSEPFVPARMALARRRRGLTKRQLAESIGLSERTINAYENGEFEPSEGAVDRICEALQFPKTFFSRDVPDRIDATSVSFRSMSRMTASQRERALAGGELALELSAWIEQRFQLPRPDLPDLRHQDPESAAIALRGRWGLGDQPISHMVRLIESKGVRVFSLAEQAQEVDAFSFWRNGKPFIFLNTFKSGERSRFDAAHELGHLVLHRHGAPNGQSAEKDANAFASAFLMPRTSIIAYAPRNGTLQQIIAAKRHWKVAVAALAYRMHAVGMLTDWHYRNLAIQIQHRGLRKQEPEGIPREMSLAFEKVVQVLFAEGVGKREIARALNWTLAELNTFIFGLVLSPLSGGGEDISGRATETRNTRADLRLVK